LRAAVAPLRGVLVALFFVSASSWATTYVYETSGQAWAAANAMAAQWSDRSCTPYADGGYVRINGWACYYNNYDFGPATGGTSCSANWGSSWAYHNADGQCFTTARTPSDCTAQNAIYGSGSCTACTGGQVPNQNATACVTPTCDLGQVWVNGACSYPENPDCAADALQIVNGSGTVVGCEDNPFQDVPETCDYSLGYGSDGFFLCSDKAAGCEAKGGTQGYVDGQEVCIPQSYSPPTCDSTKPVMLSQGGFVCSPGAPTDTKPQNSTNPNDVADATDKAGCTGPSCGSTTGTAETSGAGAGLTREQGDTGTVPGTEGTPDPSKTGKAASSGDCARAPECSGGDPQLCALLRQEWQSMCHQPQMLEEVDEHQRETLEKKIGDAITAQFAEHEPADIVGTVATDPTGGVGSSSEMSWFSSFIDDLIPSPASCTAFTMAFSAHPLVFSCERFNWLKQLLGWALYLYTVYGVWSITFAPYRPKG